MSRQSLHYQKLSKILILNILSLLMLIYQEIVQKFFVWSLKLELPIVESKYNKVS